jgi:hypothetical protein
VKIDELMPVYDLKATYSIRVAASPARVWQEIMNIDFSQMPLARRLMALRSLGRKKPQSSDKTRTLATMVESDAGGFKEIGRVPGQEIALGIIGKFWRPDAPMMRDWIRMNSQCLLPPATEKLLGTSASRRTETKPS